MPNIVSKLNLTQIALTYKNRQLKGENKLSKQIDLNVQDYIKKFI